MTTSKELSKAFAELEVLRNERKDIEERLIKSQDNLVKALKEWDHEKQTLQTFKT